VHDRPDPLGNLGAEHAEGFGLSREKELGRREIIVERRVFDLRSAHLLGDVLL
jgi:hypothetical protein